MEACTRKTYFEIYGLDQNHVEVHLFDAIIYYGRPCCDLVACLTCNKCLLLRQCLTCSMCPQADFDILLQTPDGTIIGKFTDFLSISFPIPIPLPCFVKSPGSIGFTGDIYAGRTGPDKESTLCDCLSPAEYAAFNHADEKIYTTICRCNIMDLLCACCRGFCCDRIILEMYRPSDSSKAYTLIEKCNYLSNLLCIYCMKHVIDFEIEKFGTDFPHGMLPIVQSCIHAALGSHMVMRFNGVDSAPLPSILGGHVNA